MSITASSTPIGGFTAVIQNLDNTSGGIFDLFESSVNLLQQTVNSTSPVTSPDARQLQSTIDALKSVLVNGLTDPSTGYTSYMTNTMAQQLNTLFTTLQMLGADTSGSGNIVYPAGTAITTFFQQWQSLNQSVPYLSALFNYASTATNNNIQSLIELQYVATANNMLSSQLNSLEQALNLTKTSLNTLADLQNSHNFMTIPSLGSFTSIMRFNYMNNNPHYSVYATYTAYEAAYVSKTSAFFGTPIPPQLPTEQAVVPPTSFILNNITVTYMLQNISNIHLSPDNTLLTVPTSPPIPASVIAYYGLTLNSTTGLLSNYSVALPNGPGNAGIPISTSLSWAQNVYSKIVAGQCSLSGYTIFPGTSSISDLEAQGVLTRSLGFGNTNYDRTIQEMLSLRSQLSAQIIALSAVTPTTGTIVDQSSLLSQLKTVREDLRTLFTANGVEVTASTDRNIAINGLISWIQDGYKGLTLDSQAGHVQQDLTAAISAGQSLNDSQNESVRSFLFVFEEYYKSASAVLDQLTQIIERMAQGISR